MKLFRGNKNLKNVLKLPAEPQLMLTAGPGIMAPGYAPSGVYGAPAQGVYAPATAAAAYQGYGM